MKRWVDSWNLEGQLARQPLNVYLLARHFQYVNQFDFYFFFIFGGRASVRRDLRALSLGQTEACAAVKITSLFDISTF